MNRKWRKKRDEVITDLRDQVDEIYEHIIMKFRRDQIVSTKDIEYRLNRLGREYMSFHNVYDGFRLTAWDATNMNDDFHLWRVKLTYQRWRKRR